MAELVDNESVFSWLRWLKNPFSSQNYLNCNTKVCWLLHTTVVYCTVLRCSRLQWSLDILASVHYSAILQQCTLLNFYVMYWPGMYCTARNYSDLLHTTVVGKNWTEIALSVLYCILLYCTARNYSDFLHSTVVGKNWTEIALSGLYCSLLYCTARNYSDFLHSTVVGKNWT